MPSQQKALILPSKQGAFVVGDFAVPTPGPGQLLVKIQSTGLNPVDWKVQIDGIIVEDFPAILGLDAAGIVETIGEGVTGFAKGDKVVYQGQYTNDHAHATFKQYGLAEAEVVAKIPSNLSFDQAASLPVAIATAAIGLYHPDPSSGASLSPPWEASGRGKYASQPLVVFGGSSSVGQLVIQFAKLSGFSPIFTTASPRNTELLTFLGATHVLDRSLSAAALRAAVAKATSASVETVYDAISLADTQAAAYSLLAPGGTLLILLADAIPAAAKTADKRVVHVYGGVNAPQNRVFGKGLYAQLATLLEKGELQPNPVEVLPGGLAGIVGGLDRLHNNLVSGKKLIGHPQETV